LVEDSNLKIQMSALRRALGDGQGGNRYVLHRSGARLQFRCAGATRGDVARHFGAPALRRRRTICRSPCAHDGRNDAGGSGS